MGDGQEAGWNLEAWAPIDKSRPQIKNFLHPQKATESSWTTQKPGLWHDWDECYKFQIASK